MGYPPGIYPSQKVTGGTIQLKWSMDGEQWKKSTKTSNGKAAEKIGEKLFEALQALRAGDDVPDGLPDIVYHMVERKPNSSKKKLVVDALTRSREIHIIDADDGEARYREVERVFHDLPEALKAFNELSAKFDALQQKYEYWKKKAIVAETSLGRKIKDSELDSTAKTIRQAINVFLDPKTCPIPLKGQTNYQVKCWINRLAKDVGDNKDVSEISSDRLIEHLAKFQDNKNLDDIVLYLLKFMTFSTHGGFDREPVRAWAKPRIQKHKDEKQAEPWFWLTRTQALEMIQKLRDGYGDYWADAAMLQYGCGFRSEELPLLMNIAVQQDGNVSQIALMAPKGYRLKTTRSYNAVQLPKMALEALHRRVKASKGKMTLFPMSQAGDVHRPHNYVLKHMGKEDLERDLWPTADDHWWSECYLPKLRDVANGVVDPILVDSKTLRHTCGRELIVKYGGFEEAAKVLRHSVSTLRKHYADLRSSDISTDR